MTYLEMVNSVLLRLRENEVTSVNTNAYSKMIGQFVNDSKRVVEDAWNWNALRSTITATTEAGVFGYELVDSGSRFRVLDVLNDTSNYFMEQRNSSWLNNAYLNTDAEQGEPRYYGFNGVNRDGDTNVDIFPIPDGVYAVRFNLIVPQAPLTANADRLLVPSEPVVLGAYARAIAERGEDGGLTTAEAGRFAAQSLSDAIALDANHFPSELIWSQV